MLHRVRLLAVLILLLTGLSGVGGVAPLAVPSGFSDQLVVSVSQPTDLTWLPDGRMLVTQQSGKLRLVANGSLVTTPVLDLGARVCTNSERGLLGVAVDPAFAANNFIYVYYTFNKHNQTPNSCDTIGQSDRYPVNRVARFTISGDTVNLASERILIDNIPSPGGNHNGGDLLFGKDGMLYISVGDGGSDYAKNSGSGGSNDAARDKHVLLGKILRITPDGNIPADNPFLGAGTTRCADDAFGTPGNHCQETWAWGLRNPFRFALDPNSATTRIFINDVGQNVREEIDSGQAGADYGWNCREGTRTNSTGGPCNPTPSGMVDPIFEYSHGNGGGPFQNCNSITGGAFVPNGLWPAEYDGAYLFSDYVCGKIFTLLPNGSTWAAQQFGDAFGPVIALDFGPDGTSQALYYTTYKNGGEIHRVRPPVTSNQPPQAALAASPTVGLPPLTVAFDASGSTDPEGTALRFRWLFGDGSAVEETTTPTNQHTYTTEGRFTASVVATDAEGLQSPAVTVVVDTRSDRTPPTVDITSPPDGATFATGEQITLRASATDETDGALPAARLSLEVVLHHDTHTHPFRSAEMTDTLVFIAPPPEDLAAAANSWLELRAIAVDSADNTAVVTRELQPRVVELRFATVPAGLAVVVNTQPLADQQVLRVWEGQQLTLEAPLQAANGAWWRFERWSDEGAWKHIITAPPAPTTYTATFTEADTIVFLPVAARQ